MARKGFTLIELLIVVAIIAILAAIAVPNFLEAQTRAKVSRGKSDLRTLATAIEAYTVDFNKPPPQSFSGGGTTPFGPISYGGGTGGTGTLTYALTTPVAYITNFLLLDPFVNLGDVNIPIDERLFTYQCASWVFDNRTAWTATITPGATDPFNERMTRDEFNSLYGRWRLISIAPDRNYYNKAIGAPSNPAPPFSAGMPYDPTNGTVSVGNILRSQASSEQKTWKPIGNQ